MEYVFEGPDGEERARGAASAGQQGVRYRDEY